MYSKVPDSLLVTLLRQCYSSPSCRRLRALQSKLQKRSICHFSAAQPRQLDQVNSNYGHIQDRNGNSQRTYTTSNEIVQPPKDDIAVLGGGITGLASAFFLTKELPDAKITIFEGSDTLGGWLRTKHVDVEGGTILFEQGPRTLRPSTPAGVLTTLMIAQLGLLDEVIMTSKESEAARNRFIYYPDRIVSMPHPSQGVLAIIWSLLTEPALEGLLKGGAMEAIRPKRPEDLQDESVGSFLRRRLGTSKVGDNLASAVLHGIYAGDIEKLSIQSLLTSFWDDEGEYGSIVGALGKRELVPFITERDSKLIRDCQELFLRMPELHRQKVKQIGNASVYSFKKGLGSLSEGLETYLRKSPNVEIRTGHDIDRLEYQESNNNILISSNKDKTAPQSFSRVVSTISGRKLSSLTPIKSSDSLLPTLAFTHSVTVMVINFYFKNPDLLPVHGFGYLIPRSVPFDQNPECALGVVFDSDATIGQDNVEGTKVTVMMGGHWWDGRLDSEYPTEEEGASMAKVVLKRHLGISEEPAIVLVSLQKECIPQYTVGHETRMRKANQELMSAFGGRLAVAGNSYTGVGVNDCVRAARDVVVRLKDAVASEKGLAVTGLEQFLLDRIYVKRDSFKSE